MFKRTFNLPLDWVHDINLSFGYLLFPWFGCWIGLRQATEDNPYYKGNGYQIRKFKHFHNCTLIRIRK